MADVLYDLAVIGGGINGCGIARDAAGRGLKVLLVEMDDIASATSSWSSKMVHGGLRYLEQYEFRLVRESLREREVLLKLAPHLIRPAEFIVPHDASMRPAWMVRLGLFMYDHIGGRISLPGSRTVPFPDQRYSAGLRPSLKRGFFYSDTRVDDSRLTLANALDASAHGADVRVRTRLVAGHRAEGAWHLVLADADSGATIEVKAKGVVNAAGPWVKQVLDHALKVPAEAGVKLVKGSHIVVPRIHAFAHAYLLQNTDRRVIFVIPYEQDYSLIGTTDVAIESLAEADGISAAETQYLLHAVNQYLVRPLHAADVVWSYAGVRPLYDDGSNDPSKVTRDYTLMVDDDQGKLPLLSIFGGKITTYRKLAEHVLADLAGYYPGMSAPWTHQQALPGGDFADSDALLATLQMHHAGLPPDFLQRLLCRYGTHAERVLDGVKSVADLGAQFGSGMNLLCEREIDYCIAHEWARKPDDILWRRTKCGLHMDAAERARAAAFIETRLKVQH
jgi:glycerol-3-phosphate dehydrogenase